MLRIPHRTLFCLGFSFALATQACVIHNHGGDDGASDDGGGTDGEDGASSGSADGSGPDSGASSPGDSGPGDSGPGDSGPGDSGPGDDDGTPGNQPTSGIWRYDGDVEEDTCNLGANGYDFGSYQLINNGDGSFTVSSASEAPFDCNLEGDGSFHCPARGGDAPDTMGANAHIEVTITVDGAFSSSTAGSGSQLGEMTCTGSDCALAELYLGIQFPCHVVETFTTTHVR